MRAKKKVKPQPTVLRAYRLSPDTVELLQTLKKRQRSSERAALEVLVYEGARSIGLISEEEAVSAKTNRELAWLSRNRQLYVNRWIALDGDTLLAVGNSAREVYAATAGHPGIPLVIQVEPAEGANFAGW